MRQRLPNLLTVFAFTCGCVAMADDHGGDGQRKSNPVVAAQNPSVCVGVAEGCHIVGGIAHVAVELGSGDPVITGGQFSIQYNPQTLDFVDISPGNACDPLSPFVDQIIVDIDETIGLIDYVALVETDPPGGQGTQGPATMACLTFVVLGDELQSPICLIDTGSPQATLVDEFGHRVPIDNSWDCPPGVPPPTLSCDEIEVTATCECETGPPDCRAFDSQCSLGFCNDATARCEALPINEGGLCDDGIECTTLDTCLSGVCIGHGCPAPSLCVVTDEECPDGVMTARIELGEGDTTIVAGQFFIDYDPSRLRFISIAPGRACDPYSPFSNGLLVDSGLLESMREGHGESFSVEGGDGELFRLDEGNGELFYAVFVDLSAPVGTQGPATMACLALAVLGSSASEVCLLEGVNPRVTRLVDINGQEAFFYNGEDCPEESAALSCDVSCVPIPTLSGWGLIVLALLLLSASKVYFSGDESPGRFEESTTASG